MKRLGRWSFAGLATVSLVSCLATVALWVLSYAATLNLEYLKIATVASFQVSRGEEHFLGGSASDGSFFVGPRWRAYVVQPPADLREAASYDGVPFVLGFGFSFLRDSTHVTANLYLPCWVPAVLLSMLPVIQFRRWRCLQKTIRHIAGDCVQCGYDLCATPERCPECGAIPLKK